MREAQKDPLLIYLHTSCRGKTSRVSGAQLASIHGISISALQGRIRRLRQQGHPIASDAYGYYYAVTAGEVFDTTVSRIALNKVRYVAIFEGTPLEPVQPVEEGATPAQFNWLAIAVPFGIVALVGAGAGAALFMKRRHETTEEDTE